MQIVVEKPLNWLASKRDGERNRLMYAALTDSLAALGQTFSEEPIRPGFDFLPRAAPAGGVRFSYHSVGDVRHVWRIKETPIPYFYSIERLGYSGWSELSVRPDIHRAAMLRSDGQAAQDFCHELAGWLKANNLSKYRQTQAVVNLPSRFIFFPMQVASDAVARHNRLAPVAVLQQAARYARHFGMPLVVKRHPYCKSMRNAAWVRWIAALNRHVHLTDASVTQLLPASAAVLVGNSGVGLEALVYGKPVYSFAASEYDLAAYAIRSLADVETIFRNPDRPSHEDASRFVHYYLTECCFDARNKDSVRSRIERALRDARDDVWLPPGIPEDGISNDD